MRLIFTDEEYDTFRNAKGIVDGAYDDLIGIDKYDLFDFLNSNDPKVTREMSNEIYYQYFGE